MTEKERRKLIKIGTARQKAIAAYTRKVEKIKKPSKDKVLVVTLAPEDFIEVMRLVISVVPCKKCNDPGCNLSRLLRGIEFRSRYVEE
jgi:hypothetical protein